MRVRLRTRLPVAAVLLSIAAVDSDFLSGGPDFGTCNGPGNGDCSDGSCESKIDIP
jgi:hypothetical protein